MKKFLLFITIIGFFAATGDVNAQKRKLKKANCLFEEFSFPKAVKLYKKVLDKHPDNSEAKRKLAQSYRLMNEPLDAEHWYEQVVELADHEDIDVLHYGMMLKMNGRCDKAKEMFLEYAQLVPADTRGLRQVEACEKEPYFMEDPGIYQISNVNVNSPQSDFGPAYYKDGQVTFASARGGKYKDKVYNWTEAPFLDLYVSDANSNSPANLGTPKFFKGKANTWMHEGTVTFSKDGNTMFFTRNNYFKGRKKKSKENTINLKIFTAELKGEKWSNIKELPFNSDEYSTGHPSLSADGTALYFTSDMPGGYGEEDIYVSYRKGNSWSTPENLGPEINTEGREMFPFILNDEILLFSSDALPGLGGLDIFEAQKVNGGWSVPENLRTPINSNQDDFGLIMAEDRQSGYFSSNRSGGRGDDDIYAFTRTALTINGIVVDCETQEPIEGAFVELFENGQLKQQQNTYVGGSFSFPILANKEYEIIAHKTNYDDGSQAVATYDMSGSNIDIKVMICPKELPSGVIASANCELRGLVYETSTGNPIAGATVKLRNNTTGFEKSAVTDADGLYFFELEPESDFTVYTTKQYYFTSNKSISTRGRDCSSPLQKDLGLDIGLSRIKEGELITDEVLQLNHIYYDLDKSFIRPDAAIELDKVVKLMYENPGIIVELGSHTDCRASDQYNLELSQRRAEAAVDYIVNKGISRDRIVARGYGESQLFNECDCTSTCPEEKHQENRRTEFKIIGYRPSAVFSVPRYFGGGGYISSDDDFSYNSSSSPTYFDSGSDSYVAPAAYGTSYDFSSTAANEFKVQVGAYRNPNMSRYENLRSLGSIDMELSSGGVYKIVLGPYYDRLSAEDALQGAKSRGFSDAFIVGYENGLRLD